jgi:hypothetical protein
MTTLNEYAADRKIELEVNQDTLPDWYPAETVNEIAWRSPMSPQGGSLTQSVGDDDAAF